MALRACWEDDEAEFAGRWDRFSRSMVNPKPSRGRVPVGFGCSGPLGTRLAAEHADAWLPIDAGCNSAVVWRSAIARFRQLVEGAGRDASAVPITLFVWGWEPGNPTPQTVARYAELDVERIVVCPPSLGRHERDATLRRLDEFSSLLAGDREGSTDDTTTAGVLRRWRWPPFGARCRRSPRLRQGAFGLAQSVSAVRT